MKRNSDIPKSPFSVMEMHRRFGKFEGDSLLQLLKTY